MQPYSIGDETQINDLEENNLYKLDPIFDDESLDIAKKFRMLLLLLGRQSNLFLVLTS